MEIMEFRDATFWDDVVPEKPSSNEEEEYSSWLSPEDSVQIQLFEGILGPVIENFEEKEPELSNEDVLDMLLKGELPEDSKSQLDLDAARLLEELQTIDFTDIDLEGYSADDSMSTIDDSMSTIDISYITSPSTYSSVSSPASESSDGDWVPDSPPTAVKKSARKSNLHEYAALKTRKTIQKKRGKRSSEERKQRKMYQNKVAAERYRIKKRSEQSSLYDEQLSLEKKNRELQSKVGELNKEIKYLKNLMKDVFKARGFDAQ